MGKITRNGKDLTAPFKYTNGKMVNAIKMDIEVAEERDIIWFSGKKIYKNDTLVHTHTGNDITNVFTIGDSLFDFAFSEQGTGNLYNESNNWRIWYTLPSSPDSVVTDNLGKQYFLIGNNIYYSNLLVVTVTEGKVENLCASRDETTNIYRLVWSVGTEIYEYTNDKTGYRQIFTNKMPDNLNGFGRKIERIVLEGSRVFFQEDASIGKYVVQVGFPQNVFSITGGSELIAVSGGNIFSYNTNGNLFKNNNPFAALPGFTTERMIKFVGDEIYYQSMNFPNNNKTKIVKTPTSSYSPIVLYSVDEPMDYENANLNIAVSPKARTTTTTKTLTLQKPKAPYVYPEEEYWGNPYSSMTPAFSGITNVRLGTTFSVNELSPKRSEVIGKNFYGALYTYTWGLLKFTNTTHNAFVPLNSDAVISWDLINISESEDEKIIVYSPPSDNRERSGDAAYILDKDLKILKKWGFQDDKYKGLRAYPIQKAILTNSFVFVFNGTNTDKCDLDLNIVQANYISGQLLKISEDEKDYWTLRNTNEIWRNNKKLYTLGAGRNSRHITIIGDDVFYSDGQYVMKNGVQLFQLPLEPVFALKVSTNGTDVIANVYGSDDPRYTGVYDAGVYKNGVSIDNGKVHFAWYGEKE